MSHTLARRLTRLCVAMVTLALVAGACTSGDPADEPSEVSDSDPVTTPPTTSTIAIAPGATPEVDEDLLSATAEWIAEESGLSELLQEEIFLDEVTQTQDITHLTFLQQHDEVSVRGAQFVVHIRDDGEVIGASQSLTETLPGADNTAELDAVAALDIAEKAVPGPVVGDPVTVATWLEVGTELRLGWEVQLTTGNPPSAYSVVVDATDGMVLSVDRLASNAAATRDKGSNPPAADPARRDVAQVDDPSQQVAQQSACGAPTPPSACIFVVDPIYASGNPAIDPAAANSTLVGVPLQNLLDPNDGQLIGRYVEIAPEVAVDYIDADGVFGQAGRGGTDVTFEAGMSYYWIDYTQQIVQELGYRYHSDDPVEVVPIEPQFADNAFYLFNEDRIHMGIGADGVNEAEDAQGIIHEYGHALLQDAVPDILTEEGGAFHEGFGDLVSLFTTLEYRNGDIPCLFHWAERGACIRRVDGTLVYPQDLRFEVHLDGEIFTGAVWEIFVQALARDTGLTPDQCQDRQTNPCDAVRDQVYGTLLGSLPFLTPQLDLDDAATAFAVSDQTFYNAVNAELIQQVFGARGLAAAGTPTVQIEGLMDFETADSVASVKILHSYRGDLSLRLDVVDASGQELCTAPLVNPDPDDSGDNITGRFRLDGTPCEAFLPPGPDQIWLMTTTDVAAEDEGTFFQFAVAHQGQRFLAANLPQVIPDADQVGVTAQIGGTAPATMGVDGPVEVPVTEDAAPPDGAVTVQVDISHTYVGDLSVQLVVADLDNGGTLCRVDLHQPDPQDSSDDLRIVADASLCSEFFPPSPTQPWLLRVSDVADQDEGVVNQFSLTGPGLTEAAIGLPAAIPDNDVDGVLLPILG